jgi:HEPN domain-containing protein
MDEAKEIEIRNWLTKAAHDLGSARRLLEGDEPLLDTAVFHCQQAAEKSLKAYLTFCDEPFDKIHTLGILVAQCERYDAAFAQLREAAVTLTPYAVRFRYPGEVLEPFPEEAHYALELAQQVYEFVLTRLPQEVYPVVGTK